MEQELAIQVKDLSIHYKGLRKISIKRSLLQMKREKVEVFQAVKNVSFSISKGSIVGLIGKNGSGKSTMLNAIAGIFSPDTGTIDLFGNSVSLLSIGVGFQRELSGRENILLSGMLLGFSEAEIQERTPEIIEFAELGSFIDMPVKTYSSGMYSKLAFSITAILETDIILIDEVLSVGDTQFKKKSYQKMRGLISDDHRTVVIVSHNMATLKELCDSVIWLHQGEIKMYGDAGQVINAYLEAMK